MKLFKLISILTIAILFSSHISFGQDTGTPQKDSSKKEKNKFGTTEFWLEDDLTIPIAIDRQKLKNTFNGFRLIYEPQFGAIIQEGSDRFIVENFKSLDRIGFETNLYMGYVSLQTVFLYPSVVQLDDKSSIRLNNYLIDPGGKVTVDYGISVGASFFEGIIAIGFGGIFYDKRDFQNIPNPEPRGIYQDNFWYVNVQPLSAVRAAIKVLR